MSNQDATDRRFYQVITADDVADDNHLMLANLLRALTTEMRSGFEMLREEIRQTRKHEEVNEDRTKDLEQRVAVLEQPKRKARK